MADKTLFQILLGLKKGFPNDSKEEIFELFQNLCKAEFDKYWENASKSQKEGNKTAQFNSWILFCKEFSKIKQDIPCDQEQAKTVWNNAGMKELYNKMAIFLKGLNESNENEGMDIDDGGKGPNESNKNEGMDIDDGGKGKKEEKNAEEEWPKIVNPELRTQLLKSSINSELSFAGENPFFNPDQ